MELVPLPRTFFGRSPIGVAPDLLGKLLVRKLGKKMIVGRIVETEAYLSVGDEAAHGYKGPSARNASLFKEGGRAYVHGMRQYFLLDVVTEGEGTPSSVLIRAVEPVQEVVGATHGPGLVGRAFGITRVLDGVDMTDVSNELFIAASRDVVPPVVLATPRVGISTAKELLLRFTIAPGQ